MSKRSATAAALEEEQVVVAKLPGRFAKNANGEPMKWPVKEGYSRVNVCSSSPGASKQLSPMLVGPVDIEKYIGIKLNEDEGFKRYGIELPRQATNVENLWYALVLVISYWFQAIQQALGGRGERRWEPQERVV